MEPFFVVVAIAIVVVVDGGADRSAAARRAQQSFFPSWNFYDPASFFGRGERDIHASRNQVPVKYTYVRCDFQKCPRIIPS